jgi:hypothetical protein
MSEKSEALTATIVQMAVAFEKWENDYRANPELYMTVEQTAAAGVSTLSADRAAHFYALLADGNAPTGES